MSMKLQELRKQHNFALDKADSILRTSQSAGVDLTANQSLEIDSAMTTVRALAPQIKALEDQNSILKLTRPIFCTKWSVSVTPC
jgi:hypothetical protein